MLTSPTFPKMTDPFFDIRNKSALLECPPGKNEKAWHRYIAKQVIAERYQVAGVSPVQIDIEINGSCNMACPFCIHGIGEGRSTAKLTWEQYTALIDEAASIGTASLKLNYINEPLLIRWLDKAIKYAVDAGILNIYFVTNGSLLNAKRRAELLASGVTKIFVSIDAATSETYNKQRRNGAYGEVVANVKALIKERNALGQSHPLVRVSFLKNQTNIHEADLFFEQWNGIADVITFQTMNEVPGQDTGLTIKREEKPESCSFPFKQLVVDSEGDILPCCKLYGKFLAIGNIKDMTLSEAWNSVAMVNLRKAHATDTWDTIPTCKTCLYNDAT